MLLLFFVALAVAAAAAAGWGARLAAAHLAAARADARRARTLTILQLFTPAIAAAQADPRALLTWQPIARAARALCPEEFADIDRASGATFPFTTERIQAAHAQWTAEWLAWERAHDVEFKQRAAEAGDDRGKADRVEREKLDSYQRRYEEYIRVAKALQALTSS